ncbi:ATP-binding protein [Desulfopila sp. IMCC35008]|uniref:ATP-binding protein n=1 Tax=Desulfopila sp. IMCC35008 TaxID=2653858 RepID=UPI003519BB67
MKYICEPFFTTKSLGRSGSGLGMTVVRSAVEDHGGYMEIKSKKMGGTAIIIYLPEAENRTGHNTPDTHPSFQDRGTA